MDFVLRTTRRETICNKSSLSLDSLCGMWSSSTGVHEYLQRGVWWSGDCGRQGRRLALLSPRQSESCVLHLFLDCIYALIQNNKLPNLRHLCYSIIESPLQHVDHYSRTKAIAEQAVLAANGSRLLVQCGRSGEIVKTKG